MEGAMEGVMGGARASEMGAVTAGVKAGAKAGTKQAAGGAQTTTIRAQRCRVHLLHPLLLYDHWQTTPRDSHHHYHL